MKKKSGEEIVRVAIRCIDNPVLTELSEVLLYCKKKIDLNSVVTKASLM